MNRALRAATMGALLIGPVALTACSAGQVTQTATQDRDKVGPSEQVGDILLRQVLLEYPEEGAYEEGEDASLVMAIVNTGQAEDTLLSIEGEGFDEAVLTAEPTPVPPAPDSPAPDGTTTPSPGATATTSPEGTATTSPENTATPGTPTTTAPATGTGSAGVEIPIPGNSTVFLGPDDTAVELVGLSEPLTPGQGIELTLTFAEAGEVTVTARVNTPGEALERGEPFDFHHEEQETGSDSREAASGAGQGE
ncbi:hypothetical protein ACI8AC_11660 [Geodermatophilus sp. SYSU D00758]